MLNTDNEIVANGQTYASDAARYRAFAARDINADGRFIVAVKTTGIYCRPNCSARPPKRENIEFFDDIPSARAAGYRACLRCKPDGAPQSARIAKVVTEACRRLERDENVPSVADLARVAGFSEGRFHKLFKQATGLSPKQYALAKRVEKFRERLKGGETVTAALYDSGFNSSSRAYEASRRLGLKPRDVKTGGAALVLKAAVAKCSLGFVGIAMSERGLCALAFGDTATAAHEAVQSRFPKARLIAAERELNSALARVVALVEAPSGSLDLPLDIRGTVFQERVWQALRRIPAGKTRSYTEIAKSIGHPTAQRAVAQACGANKIAVAIPCHRVVASDGGLGGYHFGTKRKKTLLAKEAAE
ncbi:MAG: bifunctional DNA-binding transcriptional regulator/O6-methylguanine-DNA methyltransferase Ada [Alphaproteobacteria bacterium]|nr:bifunctional DNA-binding transcriptional regulator/O6-methylguanine-DNA methyltransferase Ada [Alphaproteobacteria bacterium]